MLQASLIFIPGLFFYGSLVGINGRSRLIADAPATSSLIVFTSVITGSIAAHLFGVLLLEINKSWVATGLVYLDLGHDFDPYSALQSDHGINAIHVLAFLIYTIFLCFFSFLLGWLSCFWPFRRQVHQLRYGQFSNVITASDSENQMVYAHVLTNTKIDNVWPSPDEYIGYIGYVENLSHDKNGVRQILLVHASPFYLKPTTSGIRITHHPSPNGPIDSILIPHAEIKNLSLKVLVREELNPDPAPQQ